MRSLTFEMYRYQLVPTTTFIQTSIDGISSYEELVARKNEILFNVLTLNNLHLLSKRSNLIYKIIGQNSSCKLIKIGKRKDIDIDNQDFEKEKITVYPNIYVFFNNHPDQQIIYIQRNTDAFQYTKTVVSILERTINRYLHNWQLKIYIKPIISEESFWELVKGNEDRLTQLSFNLIKPNLANISSALTDDIKNLQRQTNSHTTKLELNAPSDSVLENINPQNKDLAGIVEYSNEGGGDISIKMKGIRKKIKPSEALEVTIEEVVITGKADKETFDHISRILC